MTTEEAKDKLEQIHRIANSGDDECAHGNEDALHEGVLTHISEHCTDEKCRELAGIALKTKDIRFCRWCA